MVRGPSAGDRRRFLRYPCALSAMVEGQPEPAQLVTSDVSRHGAFLLTDQPRAEQELVRLRFELPSHGALEVVGTVAHRVLPGDPATAELPGTPAVSGMGVDFLALSREAKDAWDEFVFALRAGADGGVRLEQTHRPPPIRRRHVRHLSCFLVRLRDKERLRELYTRDIGAGGMLLEMPHAVEASETIELIVVHPDSEQEFHLGGRVRRVEDAAAASSPQRRTAIEFERLGTAREAALLAFIETGVNYLDHTTPEEDHRLLVHAAARVAPDSPESLVALGQKMLEADDTRLAINAFRSALTMDERCAEAHRGLHQALTDLDRPEEAAQHLSHYERLVFVAGDER